MRYLSFLTILSLSIFLGQSGALAQRVLVDGNSAKLLGTIDPAGRFACYRPLGSNAGMFGQLVTRAGKTTFNNIKNTKKTSDRLKLKAKKLRSKAIRGNPRAEEQLAAVNAQIKIVRKGVRICRNFVPNPIPPLEPSPGPSATSTPISRNTPPTGNPSPEATPTASQPTATPTRTPTPTSTPTPLPPPPGTFEGERYSLAPYRPGQSGALARIEVEHFLNKVALGGDERLLQLGLREGLYALVEELLTYTPASQPVSDPNTGVVFGLVQTPYSYETGGPGGVPGGEGRVHDLTTVEFFSKWFWMYHLVAGNPLKEQLLYHLYDWFPVNLRSALDTGSLDHRHRDYVMFYRDQVLAYDPSDPMQGSFENLLRQQNYDCAMLYWLDNRLNSRQEPNQNFGRELLELFSLGTANPITGEATYDQRSVLASMRSSSGFTCSWNGILGNGQDPARFDSGLKTIFPGTPWERTENFTYDGLLHHILYGNRDSQRYIAGMLATRLGLPAFEQNAAGDAFLEELADALVANNFNIRKYVEVLLKSEAMFSPQSRKAYVASAMEAFVRMIRLASLPTSIQGSEIGGYGNNYNLELGSSLGTMHEGLAQAGDPLFAPETVFGFEHRGVWRGTQILTGENSLDAGVWLHRLNYFMHTLVSIKVNDNFNFLALLPAPNATAEETVRHLEAKLRVPLSNAQRAALVNYAGNFSTTNAQLKEFKVMGLLRLFFISPAFNTL